MIMTEIHLKNIKDTDLLLKGKEKDAYLEFLEVGGYKKMREDALREIEYEKREIEDKLYELWEMKLIKGIIEESSYDRKKEEWKMSILDLILNNLRDVNERGETVEWHDDSSAKRIVEELRYSSGKNKEAGYRIVFDHLRKGLEKYNYFNKEYDLLHKNIKEDKELARLEYFRKLSRYKIRVRKSITRKILVFIGVIS